MQHPSAERLIERVRKLHALAHSSNPAEAAAAAAKVQEFVQRYNLDLLQIEQAPQAPPPRYDKQDVDIGARQVWRRTLLAILAHAHFCKALVLRGTHMALIGEEHHREIVRYLYDSLVGQLVPMAAAAYRQAITPLPARTWKESFYAGALAVLAQRLREQQQAFAQASPSCRALIVCKDEALKQAVHAFFPRITRARSLRAARNDGYYQGIEAGWRLAVQSAVTSPEQSSIQSTLPPPQTYETEDTTNV